jgi:hypothetical protein
MQKTFQVKGTKNLDRAEKDWRATMGVTGLNHAAKVNRTLDTLTITTTNNDVLTYEIRGKRK